jgi:hypothetical protein
VVGGNIADKGDFSIVSNLFLSIFTAISDQTNHKKIFESVVKQRFQKFSRFGFERKAL